MKPCPKCGRANVRRSAISGLADYFMRIFLLCAPYRCRACRRRFYRFAGFTL